MSVHDYGVKNTCFGVGRQPLQEFAPNTEYKGLCKAPIERLAATR